MISSYNMQTQFDSNILKTIYWKLTDWSIGFFSGSTNYNRITLYKLRISYMNSAEGFLVICFILVGSAILLNSVIPVCVSFADERERWPVLNFRTLFSQCSWYRKIFSADNTFSLPLSFCLCLSLSPLPPLLFVLSAVVCPVFLLNAPKRSKPQTFIKFA